MTDIKSEQYTDERYLGDGLYVCITIAGQVRLRAPRSEGNHLVYLEADVLDSFLQWLADIRQTWRANLSSLQ